MKAQKFYIKGIVAISIAVPIILTLVICAIINGVSSSMLKDFATSKEEYASDQSLNAQIPPIKAKHKTIEPELKAWEKITTAESYILVNNTIRKAVENHDHSKTMQITSGQRGTATKGITAAGSAFALEGTFTELQNVMLETESKLPNLMVGSMNITPQRGGKLLELKLNLNSWETKK